MRYKIKHSYTLIEILAVLAIAGILLGMALPAFEKLTKSNRVDAASTAIGSAISLARAQAIGNRRYVAEVIPATTANGNADLQPYIYKGYRLCFVNHTGNNYVFDAWLPD
ncbi:MAG: prepilin-type N-terminal cleavage/methylation domain-containing protein, partial [Victivallales bacterium]|nr:prepilin-type N-terminal cleavage/methylation domain-containing protein [Victivallales bacterium]